MSFSKSILKQWSEQRRSFDKSLATVQHELSTQAVHQLRVSIKKLRSYMVLDKLVTKSSKQGEHIPDTVYLFGVLGKYRDLELQLEVMEGVDCPLFKSFLEQMKMQVAQHIQSTVAHYQNNELTAFDTIINVPVEKHIDKQAWTRIQKHIRQDYQKLQRRERNFLENAHSIRKRLKNIGYWLLVFPEKKILRQSTAKKLHHMVSLLGQAHDAQLLRTRMKHFQKEYLVEGNPEIKILKKMERKVTKHNKQCIRQTRQIERSLQKLV